jgi:hypothetical protein
MHKVSWIVAAVVLTLTADAVPAQDKEEARGKKVKYQLHSGYTVVPGSGLHGSPALAVFTDPSVFDKVLSKDNKKGKKVNLLPEDAFDKKMVVAAVFQGNNIFTYKVVKVTADGETLYVQFQWTSRLGDNPTQSYVSPLLLSVDRGEFSSVVFLAGTQKKAPVLGRVALARGEKVAYQQHTGYVESPTSGLKAGPALLTFSDRPSFDKVFAGDKAKGQKVNLLPEDAFDTKLVIAALVHEPRKWIFLLDNVTADGETLYVQYRSFPIMGSTGTLPTALIVAVDRGKYNRVIFLNEGKKMGTVEIAKEKKEK